MGQIMKIEEKLDQVSKVLSEMRQENLALRKENKTLRNTGEGFQMKIRILEDRINGLEQYTPKNYMVISGVPVRRDEKVEDVEWFNVRK